MSAVGFDLRQISQPFLKKIHFWVHLQEKYIYIRYFPLRDRQGNYLGTLEVSPGDQRNSEDRGGKEAAGLELKLPLALPLQLG
jgi:hypothetical protein